jgi:hypothetical protein
VYAAGQILWELIMGRPAFTGSSGRVRAMKRRQVVPLMVVPGDFAVSHGVEELIALATQPHPARRPGVLELVEKAAAILPDVSPPAVVTPVNLSFAGEIVGGLPGGWFNGLGLVARASVAYDVRVEAGEPAVRLSRRGAHPAEFGTVMQRVPAAHLRGRTLRFRGELACEDLSDWGGLWLRADGDPIERGDIRHNTVLFFDNMHDRGVRGTASWSAHEIEVELPDEVRWLNYGVLLNGEGILRARNLELETRAVDGQWRELAWEKLIAR